MLQQRRTLETKTDTNSEMFKMFLIDLRQMMQNNSSEYTHFNPGRELYKFPKKCQGIFNHLSQAEGTKT